MINITVKVVSVKSVNLLAKVQDKFHKKWLSVNESDLLVEARIIVSHFNLTMKPSEVATTSVAVPLLTVFSQQIPHDHIQWSTVKWYTSRETKEIKYKWTQVKES